MTTDANGHKWVIGRFQTDDEQTCRFCRCDSTDPEADKPCAKSPIPSPSSSVDES